MNEPSYRLVDLGDRRVLALEGRDYPTGYSERVIRILIGREGVRRTPSRLCLHYLNLLFRKRSPHD